MVLLATSTTAQLGSRVYGYNLGGVYFSLQCSDAAAPLIINALGIAGYGVGGDHSEAVLYMCDGAGREQRREGWRQVGSATHLKDSIVTRLMLSSPVAVRAGATVGFYLYATRGYVVRCAKETVRGEVDASDGMLLVLVGGQQISGAGLFGKCAGYCTAPAGFIEYEFNDLAAALEPEPEPELGCDPFLETKLESLQPKLAAQLWQAARAGYATAVERLIAEGASPDAVD
eukprot:COSAG02_NODE_17713_length_985_cov_2.787810_1_plen_229_part_10